MKTLKIFSAILVPPFSVYLQSGFSRSFWINIPLTCLGVVPGVIHAIWGLSKEKNSIFLDRLSRRT